MSQVSNSTGKTPKISIVVPAYNESRRVGPSLKDMIAFFGKFAGDVEVLLVVEKSKDQTVGIAKDLIKDTPNFHVIPNSVQKGKGFAVKTGMLMARGDIVFFMDLDLSTPLVEILNFTAHFESNPGVDVVIGSRQHAQSQVLKRQNVLRQKMGQTFNLLVQTFAVKGITDTQCGFKAFRKSCVIPIFSRQTMNGFSFDVEVLMLAQRMGFIIDVLPVKWINSTESKVRIVRDSLKMFIDVIRIRWIVLKTLRKNPFIRD